MDSFKVYKDMKARTNGEIYIGVVGAGSDRQVNVHQAFCGVLILPNLKEEHVKQRTQDELPQAASGTTIMTTEPEVCSQRSSGCKAFR